MKAITSLPEVLIMADGKRLDDRERASLGSVRVQQRLSLPTLCELSFLDPPRDFDVVRRVGPGVRFMVEVAGSHTAIFEGETTAVEHVYEADRGLVVRVRGYDPLHRLRKRQQVRTFTGLTSEDLARQLVVPTDLKVHARQSGPRWSQITQHAQTDFDLLQEITARAGIFFFAWAGELRMFSLEGDGEQIYLEIGRNVWEARVEINADRAAGRVVALGWDPRRFEVFRAEATQPRTGRNVEAAVSATDVGGSDLRLLPDVDAPSHDLSRAAAQAELELRSISEVTVWGVAEGNSHIHPGVALEITGISRAFAGSYVVTTVTHTIDEGGFLSEFNTEPPPDHRRDRIGIVSTGVVTDVDDPDRLGRVRVSLPTFDDALTEWMQVVLPAAGDRKGLIALPDVDDQVLVAFPHGDPARGIVLGAVFGSGHPSDAGVEGGRVQRYAFLSRGGQQVVLDDTEGRVRIGNASGSYVELRPNEMLLHAASDLTIRAPGQRIRIIGDAINFERG